MSEQKINLQKILQSEINKTKYAYTMTVNWDVALAAMKNACEKILEVAAEKSIPPYYASDEAYRRSIKNTINQIE